MQLAVLIDVESGDMKVKTVAQSGTEQDRAAQMLARVSPILSELRITAHDYKSLRDREPVFV
jgi:hypothetical protein